MEGNTEGVFLNQKVLFELELSFRFQIYNNAGFRWISVDAHPDPFNKVSLGIDDAVDQIGISGIDEIKNQPRTLTFYLENFGNMSPVELENDLLSVVGVPFV